MSKRFFSDIAWPSMMREYAQLIQPATDISPEKHAQLLKMSHERIVYSFSAMPITAIFAALFYGSQHEITLMGVWALSYCVAYIVSSQRARQFDYDFLHMDGYVLMAKWIPKLKVVVSLHGIGLCAPLVITAQSPSFEFNLVWCLVIAANTASNAAHQTPVLGIFARFFNCSWNLAMLLSFAIFPNHWYFLTPMFLMFSLGIYRNALIAHKFFLQQVRLEESSTKLAEQFKIAKDAAEDALRAKNQFLATASHDLRQPAHAMSMLIEAISNRNRDASLAPALADLRSSLRAMNLMFNSLLDLSKLESGVIAVDRKPAHLQPLLRELSAMFEHEARDRELELRLHLPTEAAITHTDPNLLRQVVMNLLQNALRYTKRGGVLLAVRRRGPHWQVEVCDTGIGVAEEAQMDIYLPYFRQEHAWGVQSEGHGLGLSVVARCALLLKAPIDMKSRLGRGSRFWISLPRLSQDDFSEDKGLFSPEASQERTVLQAINRGCCLIVEDDPQVSRAWQLLMQSWGVDTRIVTNSAEALACLDEGFKPEVIFCDERLRAGESGFELLQVLLARLPDAHGAMVSGEFNSPALLEAVDEGYLVFRKPLEIHLIHGVLSRWL